jgi:hypothetical protein
MVGEPEVLEEEGRGVNFDQALVRAKHAHADAGRILRAEIHMEDLAALLVHAEILMSAASAMFDVMYSANSHAGNLNYRSSIVEDILRRPR